MRTLTSQQQNILNATVKKVSWLFEIDQNYNGTVDCWWSTEARSWNGHSYVYKIMSFTPLTLNMGSPDIGIVPPTKITIQASFKDHKIGTLYASEFEGGSLIIRLVASTVADGEAEIMAWRFKIISAWSVNQIMTMECQDWFTPYLEGDYPDTPLVSNLFPADIMKDDNVCVPIPFGTPFFPIRWIIKNQNATYVDVDTFTVIGDQTALFSSGQFLWAYCGVDGVKSCWVANSSYASGVTTVNLTAASGDLTSNLTTVSTNHYLLGPLDKTYTIERARTPREVNFKTTYLATDYTFKQCVLPGTAYKVVQLLCDDANHDDTNDANGYWGIVGKEIYDMPCRFSRSDLATKTNPADIASWIFQDWGISSDEIDDTSRAAAAAIFTARSFSLDIGLWYQMPREKVISKLFTLSGMIPVYRDKIGFKVLTKVSQKTITEDMVDPTSFRIGRTFTQKQKDSGYVAWQKIYEPVDQVNKSLVAAKSSTSNPSDTTIEAEWVLDAVKAQKAGKLALQRILLRDKVITFTARSSFLALEPGDVITISPQNFGAEGSSYNCLITRMSIREGLWVNVECIRFSDSLDDWDDISASDITIVEANTDRSYSPVYQGQIDADGAAGSGANVITQTVQIGAGGVLATNIAPETNGGFKATNTELTCYNTSGNIRFQAIYGGTDQGDVTIGNYAGDQGCKWDQSAGTLEVRGSLVTKTGSVKRFEISSSDNEAHFYGDRGDSVIEELATIGIKTVGEDNVIGYFGSSDSDKIALMGFSESNIGIYGSSEDDVAIYGNSTNSAGVEGRSTNLVGVYAYSVQDYGVYGYSENSVGGCFGGSLGAIILTPSASSSAPTHSAEMGTFLLTSAGIVYVNISDPSPGTTWQKVSAQ